MIFFSRTTGPTNIITKMKDKKRATPSPSRDNSKYENFLNWPDFSQTWHKAFKSSTLLEEIITGNFESSPEPLIQFRPKLNPMLSKVKFVRLKAIAHNIGSAGTFFSILSIARWAMWPIYLLFLFFHNLGF